MESRAIQLTPAAHKHGNLNIRSCGKDFFPPDAFGGPSRKAGLGVPITLQVDGLPNPIETDIPRDNKTGKARWIFRKRKWVKDFVRCHKLHPNDTVTIERVDKRTYKVNPNNHHPRNNLKKWLNTIQCMDCVEGMKQLPANCIDLVVTSPPYDGIRKYKGFRYDLHATGKEILRILKDGGIAVMVIQDQTRNFAKTLTSFRTVVDWCDNIGFRLFETVIYRKHGTEGAWWTNRFRIDHEYMPIFMKGTKPQYFNKEPLKILSKHGGKVMTGSGNRRTDGKTTKTVRRPINKMKCRGTVWNYLMAGDKNPLKRKHPAVFPDKIPYDFIQCFCPPDGIVLDPFIGSGSTAVAAKKLKRNYIGFDISEEYCKLAEERIRKTDDYLFG